MNVDDVTLINYIKKRYPKVVFTPLRLTTDSKPKNALGFVISDNKLVMGYITKNGTLCKLMEPVDLSELSHSQFIDLLSKIPLAVGFDEHDKQNLLNVLQDKEPVSSKEHQKAVEQIQRAMQSDFDIKYNMLIETNEEKNQNEILLIKKEYESKMDEIKEQYNKDIEEYKQKVKELQDAQETCKAKLLGEKDQIIQAIQNFRQQISDYIGQIAKNNGKDSGATVKLNEMYTQLLAEKTSIENSMSILTEQEKQHLKTIQDNESQLSEFTTKLNNKEQEVSKLNDTIKEIQNELDIVKKQFSEKELESVVLAEFKKNCLEQILNEKEQIIDKIKEYNSQWLEWAKNNNYNVEQQKDKLKNELDIIYKNLKKVLASKDKYLEDLGVTGKDKDIVLNKLKSNISDIKLEVNNSLNEQLTQLSLKNQELENNISESTEELKKRDSVIQDLRQQLEEVKKLLEKNGAANIPKEIDYNSCNETLQKFYRKKEVMSILDGIINNPNKITSFTNLNDQMKNNIKTRFETVKQEINKHIDFLDLTKYVNSPNIQLFKSKATIKNIPPEFCEELNNISSYWDNNVGIFREQDRILTNIYEDLSGAVRVYIKIKPLIGKEQQNKTVYIENHTKKVTVDCTNVPDVNKKETFGEFYGIFNDTYTNKDVYTGIQGSGDITQLNIDVDSIEESNDTISPGLYSTFKQVEDGYSIVLFGYGLSGSGKCHGADTPIIMYDGTIKKVQDIQVGDLLMGDDSTARRVFSLARGRDIMYEVTNVKGESYTVNSEHILSLKYTGRKQLKDRPDRHSFILHWFNKEKIGFDSKTFSYKNRNKEDVEKEAKEYTEKIKDDLYVDIPIKRYLSLSNHFKDFLKGYKVPVEFPHRDLEIDPYMIGFWLGDGTASQPEITNQDSTIIKYFKENLQKYKCYLQYQSNKGTNNMTYRINGEKSNACKGGNNYFLNILKKYNLINNKHIPHIYKCNSREQRLKLLAGILDADGSYDRKKRTFEFSQSLDHEQIMDDVIYLCHSLGFACYKNKKKTSWTYLGVKNYGEAWRISITGEGIEKIPTLCPRKQAEPRRQIKDVLVSGIKIKELPEDDYYGFEIDGNHHYLLGNFTVTHNTYSLIGDKGIPGLLHYGLANLKGVSKIRVKYLFEQYIDKFVPTINKIKGRIINLVNEVPQMRNYANNEEREFAQFINGQVNLNDIRVENINTLTGLLEKYRIEHSRIKKTPNNPVSSRSHLYMVFEVQFEGKDGLPGKVGYVTIVDTAGRESPVDIYNMFIDTTKRISLTTILGPTGGAGVVKQFMKEQYTDYDATAVFDILKEGFYINETINHLIYFFNKKNYRTTKIQKQISLEKYSNDKYYVDPRSEEDSIDGINNCLMIPILKFLDAISNRKQDSDDFKPTKFAVMLCVRTDLAYCRQIFSSMEFGEKIRST
jgi:hypothetical protein